MRALIINKMNADLEAGIPPSPEIMAGVGKLVEDMTKAGVMLAAEGVRPSSEGARVRVTGGRRTVTDGPFAETKELIGGFMVVQVRNLDEALEWAARLSEVLDDEVEVRRIVELSDFDTAVLSDEERERQQAVRDRLRGS
jgi:hypothetical protein